MGRGRHELVNRLHLHPDVQVERSGESDEVRLRMGDDVLRLGPRLSMGKLDIVEGAIVRRFGRRIVAPVIRWTRRVESAGRMRLVASRRDDSSGKRPF